MWKSMCLGVAVLTLAACGSGGGGSGPSFEAANPVPDSGIPLDLRDRVRQAKILKLEAAGEEDEILQHLELTLGGRKYVYGTAKDKIDFNELLQGKTEYQADYRDFQRYQRQEEVEEPWAQHELRTAGRSYVYQNNYSLVMADYEAWREHTINGVMQDEAPGGFSVAGTLGLAATESDLAALQTAKSKFSYQGVAFTNVGKGLEKGDFRYSLDFGTQTGSGTITGLTSVGDLVLEEGKGFKAIAEDTDTLGIQGDISGRQVQHGGYQLAIYGPKAEELAGEAMISLKGSDPSQGPLEIGIAGKR